MNKIVRYLLIALIVFGVLFAAAYLLSLTVRPALPMKHKRHSLLP